MKTNYNAPKSFSDALVKFSMEIAKAKWYSRPIDAHIINECADEFTKAFANMYSKVKTLRDELKCMEEINEYQSSLIDELITERDVITEMYHDAVDDDIKMVNEHHDETMFDFDDLPECDWVADKYD